MNSKWFAFLLAVAIALAGASCSKQSNAVRNNAAPDAKQATANTNPGERKIKYYKSTMMLGEISQTPRKDSMGMDMAPVYEGEEETQTITVDPATVQKMGVRTAVVTQGPLRRVI